MPATTDNTVDDDTDVYVPRVFIFGPNHIPLVKMFITYGFAGTNKLDEADFVLFTGGVDINPALYGEERIVTTSQPNEERDAKDTDIYMQAVAQYIPMVGVCRGAQFLNVMNGGSLWQDMNNHQTVAGHPIRDVIENKSIMVTSTHHQGMIPSTVNDDNECLVVATTERSTVRNSHKVKETGLAVDYEVLFYTETQSLCYQPHPEKSSSDPAFKEGRDYFFDLLADYIDVCKVWFKPIKTLDNSRKAEADEPEEGESVDTFRELVDEMESRAIALESRYKGLGTMVDPHTKRTVYVSPDGVPVGYADVTDENMDDDPLDLNGLDPQGSC